MTPTIYGSIVAVLPLTVTVTALMLWSRYRDAGVWSWTFALAKLVENVTVSGFVLAAIYTLGLDWVWVVLVGAVANVVASRTRPRIHQLRTVKTDRRPAGTWTEDQLP